MFAPIKLISAILTLQVIVTQCSYCLLTNDADLFNYTLSNDIVESVAKILGPAIFSARVKQQTGNHKYMPLLPVCLDFIKSVVARHLLQSRPKFIIKPFEIIFLESCEPLVSFMMASAGRPSKEDLMTRLDSLGFSVNHYDDATRSDLYDQMLRLRIEGPFRDTTNNRLIWPRKLIDQQQLQTVKDFFGHDTDLKKSIFTYSAYCYYKKLDLYDQDNNQIFGECFVDKIMGTYANLVRRWNVRNDYLKIISDSIENTIRNCNQNINFVLTQEMINGTYGTHTIEESFRQNGNTVGDRMSPEDNQRFYSNRDALIDILLISSGTYTNLYRQSLESLFVDATRISSEINLTDADDKHLLISNLLEFLKVRSRQVYYRDILEIEIAQIIYNQHVLMACKKIKESFRGRLEARVSPMMAIRSAARNQPGNIITSNLAWIENPDQELGGISSLLNIVYQSSRMCDWFEKNAPKMTLKLVRREYPDRPLMFGYPEQRT